MRRKRRETGRWRKRRPKERRRGGRVEEEKEEKEREGNLNTLLQTSCSRSRLEKRLTAALRTVIQTFQTWILWFKFCFSARKYVDLKQLLRPLLFLSLFLSLSRLTTQSAVTHHIISSEPLVFSTVTQEESPAFEGLTLLKERPGSTRLLALVSLLPIKPARSSFQLAPHLTARCSLALTPPLHCSFSLLLSAHLETDRPLILSCFSPPHK